MNYFSNLYVARLEGALIGMAERTGSSQQDVLNVLMDRKSGATLDEIASAVGLSRTAINQQLISLERAGHVARAAPRRTGGRPQNIYVLTDEGTNLFPKQYSWFSRLLLQSFRDQMGEEKATEFLHDLGIRLSAAMIPRLVGKNRTERIAEIVKIMNETGFIARTIDPQDDDKLPRVECKNCVYHDLSKDFPEVCRFDIGFLSGLMGAEVEHQSCVQRGGDSCRFRFVPPA